MGHGTQQTSPCSALGFGIDTRCRLHLPNVVLAWDMERNKLPLALLLGFGIDTRCRLHLPNAVLAWDMERNKLPLALLLGFGLSLIHI